MARSARVSNTACDPCTTVYTMGCNASHREQPPPSREPMGTGDNGDNGDNESLGAQSWSVCGGDDDSFDSRCGFQLPPKHMLHTEQTLNKVASSLTASTVFDPLHSQRSLCRFTCGVSGRLQLQVPLPPSSQRKSAPAATPPPRLRAGKHHGMRRKTASVSAMLPAMRRLQEAQAGSSPGTRESAPVSSTPSSPTSRGSTSAVVQTGEGLASFDACESVAAMSSAIEMVLGKAHCRHHVPAVLCEHPECVLSRNSPVRLAAVAPTVEAEDKDGEDDKDDDDTSECLNLQDAQFSLRLAPGRADSFPTLDGVPEAMHG